MSLPELVESELEGEQPVAEVPLGGDDRLLVTPTRTLVYRAEGLLSDESVEEYSHDAERVEVSEGRRKAKITLDYGLDGERTVSVPGDHLDSVLHPMLAGVLSAAGITDPGESVERTFRFSELTLIVTDARLVKHIGTPVWDEDFEEFHYDDVTDLGFEEGNVATSVVLTMADRQERFKAPAERAREVRETLTEAICAHYDVPDLQSFRALSADEEGEADEDVGFEGGPDPLTAGPADVEDEPTDEGALGGARTVAEAAGGRTSSADAGADGDAEGESGGSTGTDTGFEESGFEPAATVDEAVDVAAELEELRAAVEAQREQLDRQNELIEQLIQELRQGR